MWQKQDSYMSIRISGTTSALLILMQLAQNGSSKGFNYLKQPLLGASLMSIGLHHANKIKYGCCTVRHTSLSLLSIYRALPL